MNFNEYQKTPQFINLIECVRQAIREKNRIYENTIFSSEDKTDKTANLSKNLMKSFRKTKIDVPIEYINSFIYSREQLSLFFNLACYLDIKEIDGVKVMSIKEITHITNTFLDYFEFYNDVTINPSKITDSNYKQDTITIKGNSFGPFNPTEYFKEGNFRILWLIKESYITKGTWIIGDRGGHDQAYEYYNESGWNGINYGEDRNPTIANLLTISKNILETINISPSKGNEEEIMKKVMDHICILEVNHFPGLYFKSPYSNDDLIGKWAEINKELLNQLIDFYQPDLVIGAKTFMGYFTPYFDILNWFSDESYTICSKYEVEGTVYENKIFENKIIDSWGGTNKHSMVKTEDGRYWINAYHPGVRGKQLNILKTNIKDFVQYIEKDKTEAG